jgi:serine/threonine-protein kinase
VIGETIGNFKIVQRLGRGGMGEVYLAEQTNIGTRVAIKVLRPEVSSDTEHVQRFFNEARAVSKIQHAGIVKIFDVGYASGGEAYLIMEYLEGETLAKRIEQRGHLPLPELGDFGKQIASVLGATHGAGITHRDLKPDNIYIVPDRELARGERIKILDFGIAKLTGTLAGASPQTIGTMGTPAYMAPEQWGDASKVDWRADVYSLGCVAYEMATARPPFIVTNIAEACAMHLHEIPPRARTLVPDLPVALDELLARLLEKKPEARPQSMQELARAFEAIAEGRASAIVAAAVASTKITAARESAPTMPPGTMPPGGEIISPPARRSRAPLFAIGGVAIAAAAGTAAYMAVSHDDKPGKQDAAIVATTPPPPPPAPVPPQPPPPVVVDAAEPVAPPVDAGATPAKHPTAPAKPSIDRKAVDQVFEQHHAQLARCFRKRGPTPRVVLKLTIEPDGNATQLSTEGVAGIEPCILDVVEKLKFPKPTGGAVSIEVPLEFGDVIPPDEAPADPTTEAELEKTAQSARPQLWACAEKFDLHGFSLVHLDIAADGSVRAAKLNGTMAGTPFEQCIADAYKKIKFGKQPYATSINFRVRISK